MKRFQKRLLLIFVVCISLGLASCGKKHISGVSGNTEEEITEEASDEQMFDDSVVITPNPLPIELPQLGSEPVYIYSYDNVFGDRLDSEFRSRYPEFSDMVHYVNLNMNGTDMEYMDALEKAASGSEKPSVFVVDDTVMERFMEWDYAAPISECGLDTTFYTKEAYPYTVDYGTDEEGVLKALTWQVTPGAMFYNTKIAEEVLGTSDASKVQNMVSTPEGFLEVAALMKEAGYYMVSSPDDIMQPWIDGKKTPWVTNGKLTIDAAVINYLEDAKTIYVNNYSMNQPRGTARWSSNMANGRVFCYFGSTVWLSKDSVFVPQQEKYRVCAGPFVFHLGGAYLFVGKDCPNKELVALILYTMTCDEDAMYDLCESDDDFPNNQAAVARLIADGVMMGNVLNGMAPLDTFDILAKQLDRSTATKYDYEIESYLTTVSLTYNTGNKPTIEDAVASLKKRVSEGIEELAEEE